MRASLRRMVLVFGLSVSAFCTIGARIVRGQGAGPAPSARVVVQWSDPTNGLAIGLEVPTAPLIFHPKTGWNGKILTEHVRPEDGRTNITFNPGGRWDDEAMLVVHLRNTSTNELLWSEFRRSWRVTFTGGSFQHPRPGITTTGMCPLGPHNRIQAGDEATFKVPISRAYRVWPLVPEGTYQVSVVYRGGSGRHTVYSPTSTNEWHAPSSRVPGLKWEWATRPFLAPGFWRGTISTPTGRVRVKHSEAEKPGGTEPAVPRDG